MVRRADISSGVCLQSSVFPWRMYICIDHVLVGWLEYDEGCRVNGISTRRCHAKFLFSSSPFHERGCRSTELSVAFFVLTGAGNMHSARTRESILHRLLASFCPLKAKMRCNQYVTFEVAVCLCLFFTCALILRRHHHATAATSMS
jgi:hypothetical protein